MAHRKFEHDEIFGIVQAWHGLSKLIKRGLKIRDSWLASWDYEAHALTFEDGKPTPFSTLTFDDANGKRRFVGQPFNPDTFTPVTNADFIKMIDDATQGTKHVLASLGSIRNRGRVFVSYELQGMETFKAAGREFSAFLNFGNGNDKSSVLWVNTSNICTVCDNTFGFNLATVENKDARNRGSQTEESDDLSARVKHTKNAKLKLPELAKMIDKAIGVQAEFQLALEQAANESVKVEQAERIFAGFVGRNQKAETALSTRAQNTVEALVESFQRGRGNSGENRADLFSAVTDYYSHASSGGDDRMKQFVSSEFGAGSERKGEFWAIVRDDKRIVETEKHGESLLLATAKAN